jgi:hypothetical protein
LIFESARRHSLQPAEELQKRSLTLVSSLEDAEKPLLGHDARSAQRTFASATHYEVRARTAHGEMPAVDNSHIRFGVLSIQD